jgi:hypothetical protein
MKKLIDADRSKVLNSQLDHRFLPGGSDNSIFPITNSEGVYLEFLYVTRFGGPRKPFYAVERNSTGIAVQAYETRDVKFFESAWFDECGKLYTDSFRQLKRKFEQDPHRDCLIANKCN